ncbi:MAG: hypothetical protein D6683_06165, partial [Actinomyces sp.]
MVRRITMTATALVVALATMVPAGVEAGPAGPGATNPTELGPLVVGGSTTLNDGFVAALLTSSVVDPFQAQFCGGSLIAPDVVLTAAHCIEGLDVADLEVAVGATFLSAVTPADRIPVVETAVHPGWVPNSFGSVDLAALHLARVVDGVAPVPLESDPVQPSRGRGLVVAGWGAVDPYRTLFPDGLQAAPVLALTGVDTAPLDAFAACGATDPANTVCFGDVTTGACSGDSGGPLVGLAPSGELVLEALVSFGPADRCLSGTAFDAGQRVSPHRAWIDGVLAGWAPATPPGAPAAPRVTVGDGTVAVAWDPPTDDGGDPALVYTVAGVPAGSCVTTATSCVVDGVPRGVPVAFTVTAANTAGFGPTSAATTVIVPAVYVDCSTSRDHPLADVAVSSFAFGDVGCLFELGVTTGVAPGRYGPAEVVTREQMA